jgi:nicotinamidase-related amidase
MKGFLILICAGCLTTAAEFNGFTQESGFLKDKYLIILDIQDHFTKGVIGESLSEPLIQTINGLIDRSDPERVIYIRSVLSTFTIGLSGCSTDTLPNLELDSRLKLVNRQIFIKNKANAFTSAELQNFLAGKNSPEFVVVGLMAGHCVLKTLLGGQGKGYVMFYIPDAIMDKTPERKEKTLETLQKKGIRFRMEV